MKLYAINDNSQKNRTIGYLFCYEKSQEYIIELKSDLDEWDAPLLFQSYVHKGIFTIPKNAAKLWIQERVIPSGRQNIGAILKNAGMKEYNELTLLTLSKGKCAQDDCFLKELKPEELPEEIKERSKSNIAECFLSENESIVCLFKDNMIRKLSLAKLAEEILELSFLLRKKSLLQSLKVGIGGYSITFQDFIDIPITLLREERYSLPLSATDFYSFAKNNIADTGTVCQLLDCSRQNIDYLVKAGRLAPVTNNTREKLFTMGSIVKAADE